MDKAFNNENQKYLVGFNHIEGVGSVSIKKIWDYFKCMKSAWNSSPSEFYSIPGLSNKIIEKIIHNRQNIDPDKIFESILNNEIKILSFLDHEYPFKLSNIYDPPTILYYIGDINKVNFNKTISIVGTRKPSEYGKTATKNITEELVNYNICIISGLAEGIDTIAHQTCVDNNGSTVAVLGTGLNRIYPNSNKNLFKRIIESNKGVIFSEYPPDTPPDSWRFPHRNRIISGLTDCVIIIESKTTGGAMITANIALEENRTVYAIPTKADEMILNGTNMLIKSHKAHIFNSTKDLLSDLSWNDLQSNETNSDKVILEPLIELDKAINQFTLKKEVIKKSVKSTNKKKKITETESSIITTNLNELLSPEEAEITSYLSNEPLKFDLLLIKTGMESSKLLAQLTMLELKGIILQHPGKQYSLSY